MSYRYATERTDHSALASGQVLRSAPGYPGFPVRLASELLQRAMVHVEGDRARLWDPCCGSGYLVAVLGLLHRDRLTHVRATDVDEEAVGIAARNLELLTAEGLAERERELRRSARDFGRVAFVERAEAARDLAAGLAAMGGDLPHESGVADVFGLAGPVDADLVITDVRMPRMGGMDLLGTLRAKGNDATVIVMSAYGNLDQAIDAIKAGAYDYIQKPFKPDEVVLALRKAEERESLRRENRVLREEIRREHRFEDILAKSTVMQGVFRTIAKIANYKTTVLVTGESGVGKELAARAVHFSGKRKEKKILSVHCASLPEALLERELFGGEKGAFPGAEDVKRGLIEEAEGGTLLLDEIGDLGQSLQAKMVTVLEKRALRRLGGVQEIPIDAMIIAVTNRDLNKLQQEGYFRQDLFYRLDMFSLRFPPLRDRKEDIPLLAEHFFSQYKTEFGREAMELSAEAVDILMRYNWPGNVRELKGLFAKICLLEESDTIRPEHVLARLELPGPMEEIASYLDPDLDMSLGDIERNLIKTTMKKTKGNMTQAAKLLNISYDTLRYRLKKFGIRQ